MNITNIAENRDLCCGCNACETVCPKSAVKMMPDEAGNFYPKVDSEKCVDCSLCIKVCCETGATQKKIPVKTVAATNRKISVSMKSSSGGIFSAIAEWVLSNGGVVFGTVFTESFDAVVIGIETPEELSAMLGSKYVRSQMGTVYRDIEKRLKEGRQVLFCGVPCQVAAVRKYLRKDYDNLILADIVCHGTPSNRMFKDYLDYLSKSRGVDIVDYKFRDKTYGQNPEGTLIYSDSKSKDGGVKRERIRSYKSSYYQLFLNCSTFRESCYNCQFASRERAGDLTLCDYWGVEDFHPEFIKDVSSAGLCGISAVMLNTDVGLAAFEQIKDRLMYVESDLDKVAYKNPQLNAPSKKTADHDEIMKLYAEGGYEAVDKYYFKRYRKKIITSAVGRKLPNSLQRKLIGLNRKILK